MNSRGLHTFYAPANKGPVRAKNVHINITAGNTNGTHWAAKINTRGPEWIVGRTSPDSLLTFNNVGSNPNIHVPDGVPTSPQEAANGSNDGSPTTGGTLFGDGGGGFEPPSLDDVIDRNGENEITIRPQ